MLSEYVWLGHNYTTSYVETAAACVNAGTCLEDGNTASNLLNAFDYIGKAVNMVRVQCTFCRILEH